MFKLLFLGFLIVPVLEIYLFIKVGGVIGALPTVGLVLFMAITGAYILRSQGFATLERVKQSMARGELPATSMVEGAILLVSGALLLTPGFFTDILGFIGLVPSFRRTLAAYLLKHFIVSAIAGSQQQTYQAEVRKQSSSTRIFEGDYRRDHDRE